MNTCDPLGDWSHACLILENLSHPMNLSVSVSYAEVGGKAGFFSCLFHVTISVSQKPCLQRTWIQER